MWAGRSAPSASRESQRLHSHRLLSWCLFRHPMGHAIWPMISPGWWVLRWTLSHWRTAAMPSKASRECVIRRSFRWMLCMFLLPTSVLLFQNHCESLRIAFAFHLSETNYRCYLQDQDQLHIDDFIEQLQLEKEATLLTFADFLCFHRGFISMQACAWNLGMVQRLGRSIWEDMLRREAWCQVICLYDLFFQPFKLLLGRTSKMTQLT